MATVHIFASTLFVLLLFLYVINASPAIKEFQQNPAREDQIYVLESLRSAIASIKFDPDYFIQLLQNTGCSIPIDKKSYYQLVTVYKKEIKNQLEKKIPGKLWIETVGLNSLFIPKYYFERLFRRQFKNTEEFKEYLKNSFIELLDTNVQALRTNFKNAENFLINDLKFLAMYISSMPLNKNFISELEKIEIKKSERLYDAKVTEFKNIFKNQFDQNEIWVIIKGYRALDNLEIPVKYIWDLIENRRKLQEGAITEEQFITRLKKGLLLQIKDQIKYKNNNLEKVTGKSNNA